MRNVYLYILIMACTSWAIMILPMLFIRKPIKSTFIKSFLYYVPYVTLSVMTFPAIMRVTSSPYIGICALITGMILAYKGAKLFPVSLACCGIVLVLELIF